MLSHDRAFLLCPKWYRQDSEGCYIFESCWVKVPLMRKSCGGCKMRSTIAVFCALLLVALLPTALLLRALFQAVGFQSACFRALFQAVGFQSACFRALFQAVGLQAVCFRVAVVGAVLRSAGRLLGSYALLLSTRIPTLKSSFVVVFQSALIRSAADQTSPLHETIAQTQSSP